MSKLENIQNQTGLNCGYYFNQFNIAFYIISTLSIHLSNVRGNIKKSYFNFAYKLTNEASNHTAFVYPGFDLITCKGDI